MRLNSHGRIDRTRDIRFTFDGRTYRGHPGDTVASALMARGVKLVARSFKYHRPRGVLTCGPEEPNALVEVGTGAARTPNVRATVQEIYDGLTVTSQNRIGPLNADLLSVNDALSPFLSAGFYYKTFMWPRTFWEKVYEPAIRRAAGLGRLSGKVNEDLYDKAFAQCDLLVIGGGPTGLQAALTAARGGADVILADEAAEFGGRLLSEAETLNGAPALDWVADTVAALRAAGVRLMSRTTVTGAYDGCTFGALERTSLHMAPVDHLPRETFWRIAAKRAVLAAGALERPIAFPQNDRPGVMLSSGLRGYMHRFGALPGARVAIFGAHDDAHRTARDLLAAGLEPVVIDPRGGRVPEYRTVTGEVISTRGRQGLTEITVRARDSTVRVEVDVLAMAGGWTPSVHLTCHMNGRPVWNEDLAAFLPTDDAVPGLTAAGACNGVYDTAGCLRAGHEDAARALGHLDRTAPEADLPEAVDQPASGHPIWLVDAPGRAWLDYANDVTAKDVKQSAQENFASVEHMKRYTTQGMAPDQGKSSNMAALAILADATGRGVAETGTTTYRPPFTPISLAALGAGAQGHGFAPRRLTTSHLASLAREAPMIEAGLWYRPSYFPQTGETHWRESCDREVGFVRGAVGVCDVSTLGKIDVQGPDAAAFVDFVYTNAMSNVQQGRVRYGLMLREDGHVMDDGTCARLSDTHYVITTTTAASGQVMMHLDFVSQALRPDLRVRIQSVTEQFAQFAIAGPRATTLLDALLEHRPDLPFMGHAAIEVHGIPGRLFRISFSGEQGFEIAVPARYGDALFRDLCARAEVLGGGPYGMEALNVLRIEKGFITHAEIHGRVTAFDVGMDRMISDKSDCIGKSAARRPGLMQSDRQRLVGLVPTDPHAALLAGGHLYPTRDAVAPDTDQGYITSACWSPTLDTHLALAFVTRGPERVGERLHMVDGLRGVTTEAIIVDPVFFDPDGGRMRG